MSDFHNRFFLRVSRFVWPFDALTGLLGLLALLVLLVLLVLLALIVKRGRLGTFGPVFDDWRGRVLDFDMDRARQDCR